VGKRVPDLSEDPGTLEKAITRYNECRPHSSLRYRTPKAFYAKKVKEASA
jgi:transposase InsO family protein